MKFAGYLVQKDSKDILTEDRNRNLSEKNTNNSFSPTTDRPVL